MMDLTKVRNYYIACGYTDLRLGIDGLAAVVTQQYGSHLDEESLFLFSGRRTDRIKALYWCGDGYILLYKRLSNGKFQWPRLEAELRLLDPQSFRWLMEGLRIEQKTAIRKGKLKDLFNETHWQEIPAPRNADHPQADKVAGLLRHYLRLRQLRKGYGLCPYRDREAAGPSYETFPGLALDCGVHHDPEVCGWPAPGQAGKDVGQRGDLSQPRDYGKLGDPVRTNLAEAAVQTHEAGVSDPFRDPRG